MNLRKPYSNLKIEKYDSLKKDGFFTGEIIISKRDFSKNDFSKNIKRQLELINKNDNSSRVWLLFVSNDEKDWKCVQVAQSKENVQQEVENVTNYLQIEFKPPQGIEYTNSTFYEAVCPKIKGEEYRKTLYSKIGDNYNYFKICFLNVDKYLGIDFDNFTYKNDIERIIQICKNQYAEAKIAYQTLAVYWRLYSSGIDGQTISYLVAEQPAG